MFTNLSRDHLDFHETMESYFEAKARLFEPEFAERAVVNLDSPYGRLLLDAAKIPTTGYSLDDVTDLVVERRWQPVHLAGPHRSSSVSAAGSTSPTPWPRPRRPSPSGSTPRVVAAGLSQPIVVPGRFELVDAGQPFRVVIDYAHTPDGLEQLLAAVRDVTGTGAVTVVFGCGGERDATKRPAMGEVAATLADRVVLTADNSRGEDTGAIIDAVSTGFERTTDRRATELADRARPAPGHRPGPRRRPARATSW